MKTIIEFIKEKEYNKAELLSQGFDINIIVLADYIYYLTSQLKGDTNETRNERTTEERDSKPKHRRK